MLKIKPGSRFKSDLKRFKHDRSTLKILDEVLKLLVSGKVLPEKFRDHALSGKWNPARECHIKPDVQLIYRVEEKEGVLILVRIGSHAELFS
ncbi:MAG: type II toxin-antitoxin system YafQ family toxin [Chlamydiales bacterium]|nr:type II toxin-antitoxin system YafQ family toxin [Chlamydiales bacterium]